jgi:hypothetical protein
VLLLTRDIGYLSAEHEHAEPLLAEVDEVARVLHRHLRLKVEAEKA